MGQASDEYQVKIFAKNLNRGFLSKLLSACFLMIVGMAGCASDRLWVEARESCIFESEMPPLRRVINYADPELCDRQTIVNKKKQKRLRELFPEK